MKQLTTEMYTCSPDGSYVPSIVGAPARLPPAAPHTEVLSFFQFRFDEREIFVKDSILYFQRI